RAPSYSSETCAFGWVRSTRVSAGGCVDRIATDARHRRSPALGRRSPVRGGAAGRVVRVPITSPELTWETATTPALVAEVEALAAAAAAEDGTAPLSEQVLRQL